MNDQDLSPPHKFSFDMRLLRWGGTIISSGLFIWLLTRQDWVTLWITMSRIPTWIYPLVFALYFLAVLGNALRWYALLRAQEIDIPYGEVLKIVLAGNFASNFLPSTVGGDTVRIVSAARFTGWSISLASVVVDRLLNVFVMMTLLPFSWFSFKAVGGLIGAPVPSQTTWGAGLISSSVAELSGRIRRWIKKILDAFLVWKHRKEAVVWALAISLAARLIVFTAVWILARALEISVSISQVIGVGAVIYVLTLLPISINGFGLREVTMTTLYVQLGATLEQASALVVVTRFILMVETLPGAVWISDMLATKEDE